jgi:hypothetical protein
VVDAGLYRSKPMLSSMARTKGLASGLSMGAFAPGLGTLQLLPLWSNPDFFKSEFSSRLPHYY